MITTRLEKTKSKCKMYRNSDNQGLIALKTNFRFNQVMLAQPDSEVPQEAVTADPTYHHHQGPSVVLEPLTLRIDKAPTRGEAIEKEEHPQHHQKWK